MNNIYDTINKLELEIRNHEAYLNLKAAMADVQANDSAQSLYNEFRNLQTSLSMKAQMGLEVSDEEIKDAQALQAKMTDNEIIKAFLDREQQVSQLLNDINQIVTRPIQEIYGAHSETV